ncbi:MAG: response regulator [Campylobacterales bacterium]
MNQARALVIDDSKTVRVYHSQILKEAGFYVDEAENGMEGLEKEAAGGYDLYLVDINMPVLDGYTFVERLRAKEGREKVPVIMISTEAENHDRKNGYAVGANLYYVKPVRPDELKRVTRMLVCDKIRGGR